ncbi:MAG: site-specific integrase [Nanoarchaeota archaeon]|nr:MAG: site-specific integrase [Nanoarchaeota archaeon]
MVRIRGFSYKKDLVMTFRQFWTFYRAYAKHEEGISTAKMSIEVDFAHADFDAWMLAKNFKEGDYIFDYSFNYFRKAIKDAGNAALGRHVTPKMFRKSCAMHLVNLDINEQYIKGHMGWSANSKAISHYISQQAIKKPDKLRDSNAGDQIDEIAELKMQLKQMKEMMLQKFADNDSK